MNKCFVIQPFDDGKFDRRFTETFQPAIRKADLEPYRVDKDLTARVLIDEIESNILESVICFADITTDNPNVWYELGYAFACNKDVVMICSDERVGRYPFDIQHRHIIKYNTGSRSDFETLEETITKKIKAIRHSSKKAETLNSTPLAETEGLKSHEVALLVLITENVFTEEDYMSIYRLKGEMSKSGYNDIATSVGLKSLSKKGLVNVYSEADQDSNGEPYPVTKLTEKGESWILSNEDQLVYRKEEKADTEGKSEPDNNLPF